MGGGEGKQTSANIAKNRVIVFLVLSFSPLMYFGLKYFGSIILAFSALWFWCFRLPQLLSPKFNSVSLQTIFSLQCCQIINFVNIELLKIIKSDNRDLAANFSIGVNNWSSGVI